MFAGACATHLECTLNGALRESRSFVHLRRIVGIEHTQYIEIAVADVTYNRGLKGSLRQVAFCLGNKLGQT